MVESVLTFRLRRGRRDAFVAAFRRLEVLEISSAEEGFRGAQLMTSSEDSEVAVVTAVWDSPNAYRGWLENPARLGLSEQLAPFQSGEPMGQILEIAHAVASPGPA